MTITGIGRGAREVFLTFGALLGVLCIAATIAGVAFGVKPLVFRSGSMSPAIHTGDLAVSRTVDASSLKTGDIVSVVDSEGNRVTHRLVNIASQGNARQLTLKGDDNRVADAEVYTVSKVERALFDIPKAGYVVNAAASPVGVFVLGAYVTGMLLLVFRRVGPGDGTSDGPPRARRGGARKADPKGARTAGRALSTVAFAATLAIATPAANAAWTDNVIIGGGTYSTYDVLPPVSVTCTGGGIGSSLTFRWPNKDLLYRYRVYVEKPAGNVVSSALVANNGTVGTNQSYVLSLGLLGSLLGISSTFTVRVESERVFTSTTWSSTGGPSDTGSFTLGVLTSC